MRVRPSATARAANTLPVQTGRLIWHSGLGAAVVWPLSMPAMQIYRVLYRGLDLGPCALHVSPGQALDQLDVAQLDRAEKWLMCF